MAKLIGKQIDKICNIELKPGSGSLRGTTDELYNEAIKVQKDPLTFIAAKKLIEYVKPGDTVMIATGAGIDKWIPEGETDGPLGAAALARSINIGLNAKTVITCEEGMVKPMEATLMAAGEYVYSEDLFFELSDKVSIVEPFPMGKELGEQKTEELLKKYKPVAIIFIERLAPNKLGIFHSVTGTAIEEEEMSYAYLLATEAEKRKILTIGIGDGGNEVGYGLIHDSVKEIAQYGTVCQCPCKEGIATDIKTDILISAAVSNWGAYGVAAMLSLLLKDINIFHDEEMEYRMLEACIMNGCFDGLYMKPIMYVDGVSIVGQQAIVSLMREAVNNGLMHYERAF